MFKAFDSLVWFLSYHILCASFCGTGKSCDPFCIGERHFSGQRTDHRRTQDHFPEQMRRFGGRCCCDSAAHRVRIENERKTACLCFCFSCNKEQILYITMVGIDINKRRIIHQTVALSVAAVFRQINMKMLFDKIIHDLFIFLCIFRKTV